MIITDFGDLIAERMRVEHRALAARWFERLLALLPVEARDIFPTESLLDHVPSLILEISGYLRNPQEEAVASNTAILDKARELGSLRHAQRASLHQLLREYQLLGGILETFVVDEMARLNLTPHPTESILVISRLHQAVNVLSQATIESFVTLYSSTIDEQRERLEQFTRMAAHEWRQPLGALQFGVSMLNRPGIDPAITQRTLQALERNVAHLVELTHKLESIARMRDDDSPVVQEVSLSTVAQEAARQLREMADERGVELRVADELPLLSIDVGRLELILVNLLSNAVKYSDPAKPVRFVEVTAAVAEGRCTLVVRDNGIGIPAEALTTVFRRFTRAHAEREETSHIGGIGLGLAIVADCVTALNGTIDVESTESEGASFIVTIPMSPVRASHLAVNMD